MLALAAAFCAPAAAGAAVSWSADMIHGQADYPDPTTAYRDLGVSALPFAGTVANSQGFVLLAFRVDANQIVVSAASVSFFFQSAAFNGFSFSDVTRDPAIDAVTLDPATTAPATAADATFTSDAVFLNFQGESWSSGQQAVFDIGFASPAPEPAAWTLMLVGFGALGVRLRRARRASKDSRRPALGGSL